MTNPHLLNIIGYGEIKNLSKNSIPHPRRKGKQKRRSVGRVEGSGEGFTPFTSIHSSPHRQGTAPRGGYPSAVWERRKRGIGASRVPKPKHSKGRVPVLAQRKPRSQLSTRIFSLSALAAPLYSTTASPEKQRRQHMRNGKKPTRKQKIRLGKAGLAPENWLVLRQKPNGELVILHKHTDTVRVVPPLVG